MSSFEYDKELPEEELMSSLLKGFNFFFVPNNRARITEARRILARKNGAIVNGSFRPGVTTDILVDSKIIRNPNQILKEMKIGNTLENSKVSILDQNWLVSSVDKHLILDKSKYEIEIPDERVVKKPKIEIKRPETGLLDDNINLPDIKSNPNEETMRILKEMANEYEIKADIFRARSYRMAVDSLSKTNKFIKYERQAVKLPGIGKSIGAKIQEIVKTHNLDALNTLKGSGSTELLKLFKGIYGVGSVFANKWIKEGCKTISDVEARNDLTHNQRLGIEYYDDWNERIPRSECTAHKQYILSVAREIDPKVEITVGGSYRRGSLDCGDIDYIVTKPDTELPELREFLRKLLTQIHSTGYHKCTLTHETHNKWMGGCSLTDEYLKISGLDKSWTKCRRIDFLLVPWREKGAAFIYFTGNNNFNRKIRLIAQKNGMVLNETGLYKRDQKKGEEHQSLIESFDERKIFEILKVKWREPKERNIGESVDIGIKPRVLGVKK